MVNSMGMDIKSKHQLENVKTFKYLEVILKEDVTSDNEVCNRITTVTATMI